MARTEQRRNTRYLYLINYRISRFVTYRSYKSLLETEKYLHDLTIAKFRKVLVWFRLGVNVLNVNNRYNNRSKLCPFCEEIEDERHFLLK
jgi:hypothetical protein